MNLIAAFNNLDIDISKKDLQTMGENLAIEQAETGFIDPIEHVARVKQMQELLTAYLEGMKSYAITALSLEDNGKAIRGHVEISEMTSANRLDYSKDSTWLSLDKKRKYREDELKQVVKGNTLIDEETGELIPKVPIKTHGRATIRATMK